MVKGLFIGGLARFLVAVHILPTGNLWAQVRGTSGHDHMTEVACVDVPPGEKRPEFGCFNVGTVSGLHFSQASVYWHLRTFPSRKAADAVKSATGIVVEEHGRVWLSEFGDRNSAPLGGDSVAVVGPLELPDAKSYAAVLSYAVMRPVTVPECIRAYAPGPRRVVCAGGRAMPGDSGWCEQGSGRRDDVSAVEYSHGADRHGQDAPACVRPGNPRFDSGARHSLQLEAVRSL
jgi:hypothetical protein